MQLDEMLELVFSIDGEERMEFARRQFEIVSEELEKLGVDEQNKGAMLLEMVKLFVRADHHTSYEEYSFLTEIFDAHVSFQEFRRKIHTRHPENFEEIIETIVKSFSYEGRVAFCYFGLCLLESDENMSSEEKALMERVIKADLGEN